MQLLILRHGKAEQQLLDDDNRQLAAKGFKQARFIGGQIAAMPLQPQLLALSPLLRTRQTADCVQELVNIKQVQVWPELIHGGSPASVDDKVRESGFQRILLVSHMPLVATLEAYLCDTRAESFATAELSILNSSEPFPGGWQREQRIKAVV